MDLITSVLILLSASLIIGELLEVKGFPAVVGALLVGLILGPAVFNILQPNALLHGLSEIALFFIVLLIGVDVTSDLLTKYSGKGWILTISSFVIPLITMVAIADFVFQVGLTESIAVSIGIGVPSISIISVLVNRYSLLKSSSGNHILASVVITDIMAFILLSATIDPQRVVEKMIGIAILIVIILMLDRIIKKHSTEIVNFFVKLHTTERGEEIIFGLIIIWGLLVSAILDIIGISYVLGALFSGLIVSEVIVGKELIGIIRRTLNRLNESFFIPIFFTIAGLDATIPGSSYFPLLVSLVAISAIVGGVLTYFSSKTLMKDINPRTTMAILGGRGAVGIIIAAVAFQDGVIDSTLYSLVILGSIILSLIMPVLADRRDMMGKPDKTLDY